MGDVVMATTLPFDTWRHRHNDIQRALVTRALEARVEVEPEVFGLFRDIIPAAVMQTGGELETVRERMACVPDLSLGLQVPLAPRPATYFPRRGRAAAVQEEVAPAPRPPRATHGPPERFLAEIKICGAGLTRYPRESVDKAMDRRARLLPGEYRRKVAEVDREYYGTVRGQAGPLQARLEQLAGGGGLEDLLGLCVGAFGDCSTDMDRLIRALAQSRALFLSRETGRPLSDSETGHILGQYRRVLSVTFVRSQAACLVARMGHLGQAARECAGRRRVAMADGERMRQEAAAFHTAHIRGRGRWGTSTPAGVRPITNCFTYL